LRSLFINIKKWLLMKKILFDFESNLSNRFLSREHESTKTHNQRKKQGIKMRIKNNWGFTAIEIITVMVVMGIISAFVIGRAMEKEPKLVAQKEVLKVHLRYAQARAMNSNDNYGIISDPTGAAYSLFRYHGGSVVNVSFPGEGPNIDLSALGLSMDADIIVSFDSKGIPYRDNSGALQVIDRTLTLSSGSDSESITITRNTGFIQ
jgi:hypothetical protein